MEKENMGDESGHTEDLLTSKMMILWSTNSIFFPTFGQMLVVSLSEDESEYPLPTSEQQEVQTLR